jgi:hypothetical protein
MHELTERAEVARMERLHGKVGPQPSPPPRARLATQIDQQGMRTCYGCDVAV